MIVFGLVLLLPGMCALGFMSLGASMLPGLGSSDWGAVGQMAALALPLWAVCFAISFGGIIIIKNALTK
jgi:hypothetical protein